jgi:hypothetical protein
VTNVTTASVSNDLHPTATLLDRARREDPAALATIFAEFLPPAERIVDVRYLGLKGLWGVGTHSFACVTDCRVAVLEIKLLGGVEYHDGALEELNSGVINQPSRLGLYVFIALTALLTLGVALLLLPLTLRIYYAFRKSGLVFWVREGVSVFLFTDRKRLPAAADLYRMTSALREVRLAEVGVPLVP